MHTTGQGTQRVDGRLECKGKVRTGGIDPLSVDVDCGGQI